MVWKAGPGTQLLFLTYHLPIPIPFSMNSPGFQKKVFLLLLVIVSLVFGWILQPFYGAVFWAVVLAILFAPLYQRLLVVMNQKRNLAALVTLLLALVGAIIPLIVISSALLEEAVVMYQKIHSRELDFGVYFQKVVSALPASVINALEHSGLTSIADLQKKFSTGILEGSQSVATVAFRVGQDTVEFIFSFGIMLYLLFFLLRDGVALTRKIRQAIPLGIEHKQHLFGKFATVTRATVKGNIAVALVQGVLGGSIFYLLDIQGALLWGALMVFLSLLPAVGAGLVWVPVAIYFLATGAIWQGFTLIAFGVFVIGLVDNVLRPVLVGKDTQMPDYVIFLSTLGGIAMFGLSGFIIGPVIAAWFIAAWELFTIMQNA